MSKPRKRPTDEEIRNEEIEAAIVESEGRTNFPGMTFEEGVAMALRWVLGDEESPPYTGP